MDSGFGAARRPGNGNVAGPNGMPTLSLLFSPAGRLRPQAFIVSVIVIYVAGTASELLTQPDLMAHGGLWLFAAAQALLTWVWFALHAKRLRDAEAAVGLAAGVSALYALSVALLLFVGVAFFTGTAGATTGADTMGASSLILLVTIIATLSASSSYDTGWFIVTTLTVLAIAPVVLAVAVTLWAATRPSSNKQMA
jgi:uncharacterized membrane protein YhaH (DUF805 family)